MVTPAVLNGAGCATAVLAVSAVASNKATNIFVFTDASLLSWISKLPDQARTLSPHLKYHAPSVLKRGMYSIPLSSRSLPPTSREPMGVYFLVPEGQNRNIGLKTFIRYRGKLGYASDADSIGNAVDGSRVLASGSSKRCQRKEGLLL